MMLMDARPAGRNKNSQFDSELYTESEVSVIYNFDDARTHSFTIYCGTIRIYKQSTHHQNGSSPLSFAVGALAKNIFNLAAIVCGIPFNSQAVEMNAGTSQCQIALPEKS